MSKAIMFSRVFPAYHPKAGQPTYFVEKFWASIDSFLPTQQAFVDDLESLTNIVEFNKIGKNPKHHTIRTGKQWKPGDKFSPRVWSDKPYRSKQIIIAPDIEIVSTQDFEIEIDGDYMCVLIDGKAFYEENINFITNYEAMSTLCKNDGIESEVDFFDWFKVNGKKQGKIFSGQIICWNPKINY